MFNSPIPDVIVGVLFAFMSISLAASAINEAIASYLNRRGKSLLQGIQNLLNEQSDSSKLILEIYNHALVHPQGNGTAESVTALKDGPLPSYVEPVNFAAALVDSLIKCFPPQPADATPPDTVSVAVAVTSTVLDDAGAPTDAVPSTSTVATVVAVTPPSPLESALEQITDPQLKRTLLTLYRRADREVGQFETAVANWFDGAMDRVSGVYKRYSQLWAFLIALLLVVLLNVDTLYLSKTLWHHPDMAQHLAMPSSLVAADPAKMVTGLQSNLPIGWTDDYFGDHAAWWTWSVALTGWLITALSTLFGAPFWFDLLQKVVQLRGSGPTPAEKASQPSS